MINNEKPTIIVRRSENLFPGILCTVISIPLLLLFTVFSHSDSSDPLWDIVGVVIFTLTLLFGIICLVSHFNPKVIVKGEKIHISSLFFRTKIYTFNSVSEVKIKELLTGQQALIFFCERKFVLLESNMPGYADFMVLLSKKNPQVFSHILKYTKDRPKDKICKLDKNHNQRKKL